MKHYFMKGMPYNHSVQGYREIQGKFLVTWVGARLEKFQRLTFIPRDEILKMPLELQREIREAIKKL